MSHSPAHAQPPPLSMSFARVGHSFQLMSLCCHVIIIQSSSSCQRSTWWYKLWFGQSYNNTNLSLQHHIELFHSPKNMFYPFIHFIPSSLQAQTTTDFSFYHLHRFAFFRMSYCWNHKVCSLSDWLLSLTNMHLSFLHVFQQLDNFFLAQKNCYKHLFMDFFVYGLWTQFSAPLGKQRGVFSGLYNQSILVL